jgi:hypothetical protein
MSGLRRTLLVLVPLCWLATALSHLVTLLAPERSERIEWAERRNLFLLCSSLSTNALAATSAYRYVQRRRRSRSE